MIGMGLAILTTLAVTSQRCVDLEPGPWGLGIGGAIAPSRPRRIAMTACRNWWRLPLACRSGAVLVWQGLRSIPDAYGSVSKMRQTCVRDHQNRALIEMT